jgi:hypothetical protein
MSPLKRIPVLLLLFFSILACNQKPVKVNTSNVKKVHSVPYDTLKEDFAGFISGMAHGTSGCLGRLDTTTNWKQFSFSLDSGFFDLDTSRFAKMGIWANSELKDRLLNYPVFYPFGGPDLLNANIFYPDASKYILIGLEPVGELPDLCNMSVDQVNKYLEDIRYSLKDVFKRSYFITGNMISALKKNSVNGSVPIISLFLERLGYNIISIHPATIDTSGGCIIGDSLLTNKLLTHGVKIDFAADTGLRVQSVFYFSADISNDALKKNPGFKKYLSLLPQCLTYLKAASYLMHGSDFSMIRNFVFEKSKTILQDDSGIAFRYFDRKVWDIHLYGKYIKPGKEFSWINETDLAKAFSQSSVKPLPFTLGYNWRRGGINMLYAVRK